MVRLFVRSMLIAIFLVALCGGLATALRPETSTTHSNALRGPIGWQVLLCDFSDSAALAKEYGVSPQPYEDSAYFTDEFFTPGTLGLQDYVKALSNGAARVSGSVHGWYTEKSTITWASEKKATPGAQFNDCVAAAASGGYTPPPDDRVYIITSPGVDLKGFDNRGAIGGDWVPHFYPNGNLSWISHLTPLPEIAHEFGHGIGLGHSFSNDLTWLPDKYGADAEYDNQFDLMSAGNIFKDTADGASFGGGPPFFDAHHLDEMGWIPMSRTITVGADGIGSRTVKLAALGHPGTPGYLIARVLFDKSDRFHYYTVEMRKADGWDAGWADIAPSDVHGAVYPDRMIMINEVQKTDVHRSASGTATAGPYEPYDSGSYYTSLLRQLGTFAGTGDGPPVQSLDANGVTISVRSISSDGTQATIMITTTYTPLCASGYVPRDASGSDSVCVMPAARTETANENAAGASHRAGNGCKSGYVARDAYDGDDVCVTPAQRTAAATENAAAFDTVLWNAYGPLTCKEGYVWRQADDLDYVCVTDAQRQIAAGQNAAGPSHRSGSGNDCKPGYVWREAYDTDVVCVTAAERTEAQAETSAAAAGLLMNGSAYTRTRRSVDL